MSEKQEQEKKEELDHINCKLKPQLKKDFKLVCLKTDTTMSKVLVSAIEKYVDDNRELLN